MQRIILMLLAGLIVIPTSVFAKSKTVVDYYNMLSDSSSLEYKKGSWHTKSVAGYDMKVDVVDVRNGYIKITDQGTGGGTTTTTAALFLKKDRTPVLVRYSYNIPGVPCAVSTSIKVFTLKNNKMQEMYCLLYAIPIDPFYKKGYNLANLKSIGSTADSLKMIFELPRYGTEIKATLDTGCIEFILSGNSGSISKKEKKKLKAVLANIKKAPFRIKWNAAQGRFIPVSR